MTPDEEAKITAAVELIGRTGATATQIRYCEEELPVVWMAVALYDDRWEASAGSSPLVALLRLCAELIDGGVCHHCKRMTVFYEEFDDFGSLEETSCWYQWDPELRLFRRGCE